MRRRCASRGVIVGENIMTVIGRAAIVALSICLASTAMAETWPEKPIRAFIPFGAGSATDIVPRTVSMR